MEVQTYRPRVNVTVEPMEKIKTEEKSRRYNACFATWCLDNGRKNNAKIGKTHTRQDGTGWVVDEGYTWAL